MLYQLSFSSDFGAHLTLSLAPLVMKGIGMGLCQYVVDLCFHASSLPFLHSVWHAIPTFFYNCDVFFFLVSLIF